MKEQASSAPEQQSWGEESLSPFLERLLTTPELNRYKYQPKLLILPCDFLAIPLNTTVLM